MIRFISISLLISILLTPHELESQISHLDYNPEVTHILDRLETSGHLDLKHQSVRYQSLLDILQSNIRTESIHALDLYNWDQILRSIPERKYYTSDTTDISEATKKGVFHTFYKTPYSFYTIDTEEFFLKIDPIIHFGLGDDVQDDNFVFQNTRGLKLRGTIDQKVYFFSSILENQQSFLNYEEDEITRLNAIPGQGFFKIYQSGVIDKINGWDFLNAQAYVGLKISKSIDLQIGHGRHFIGDGIRSMLLSDYGNNYFYVQLNTKIWKLHYQNTFAELSSFSSRDNTGSELIPKKYMASHYLNYQVTDRLSIGLYESVIFSRENNFEFQYLNPVILYRTVEQFLDSPDNALLGLNLKWIPKLKYQLYGQLMIDELRTDQIFSGRGWWGNKLGYQLGFKKFDLFSIDNLDLQLEINSARPYTYGHRDNDITKRPATSYTHFNQPLAHPYGANFREFIFQLKYQASERLSFSGLLLNSNYGDGVDIGRNILENYENRESDFGNITGQGIANDITALHLNASWQFFPNYFADFTFINRNQSTQDANSSKTNYWGLGLRANISSRRLIL